jgi:uracil-DNA glycosylase
MDPSGVRLRAWMGIDEEAFYESGRIAIAPMAFCFPGYDGTSPTGKGGDLPPPKVCAEIWRDRVMAAIGGKLELVLLVGGYSQAWHLGAKKKPTLTQTVAEWPTRLKEERAGAGPLTLPLPHPSWRNNAWLKKNPWFEAEVVPLLRKRVRHALRP